MTSNTDGGCVCHNEDVQRPDCGAYRSCYDLLASRGESESLPRTTGEQEQTTMTNTYGAAQGECQHLRQWIIPGTVAGNSGWCFQCGAINLTGEWMLPEDHRKAQMKDGAAQGEHCIHKGKSLRVGLACKDNDRSTPPIAAFVHCSDCDERWFFFAENEADHRKAQTADVLVKALQEIGCVSISDTPCSDRTDGYEGCTRCAALAQFHAATEEATQR